MKYYNYEQENGKLVPINLLPTSQIQDLLSGPIYITNDDDQPACTNEDVYEQLRIELVARGVT